ncbi:unnamed protein product, partial [marine sediment metagenome]
MIDLIDHLILDELEKNSRISYTELGNRASISTTCVIKRIHKLEKLNIIMGYTIHINHKRLGKDIQAIVTIKTIPTKIVELTNDLLQFNFVENIYQIINDYSLIVFFRSKDVKQLQQMIDRISTNNPDILKIHPELILEKF